MLAEQDGNIDDAQPADEQHGCGHTLNPELEVWTCSVNVVVDPKQKNKRRGYNHDEQCLQRQAVQAWVVQRQQVSRSQT